MQNSQFVAERIKQRIKEQNKSLKGTLSDLHMGINTISELSKGKEISYVKMYEFAEYLDCSVDYLLGRVDSATELIKRTPQNAVNCLDSLFEKIPLSEKEKTIINIFRSLNLEGQDIVFNTIQGIKESGRYKKRSEHSEKIS